MAKTSKFVLRIGQFERHELDLSPRDAARAATQIARGTFIRTKSMHEQPDNAKPGRAVTLYDDKGHIVMECRPSVYGQRSRKHTRTYASCDLDPKFRAKLAKKRKRR